MAEYTTTTISGYNSSPPTDDGAGTEANRVKWSTAKTKLGDPVKDAVESINTKLVTLFGSSGTFAAIRQIVVATSTTDDTISTTSASNTSLTGSITLNQSDSRVIVSCYGRVDVRHDGAGSNLSNRTCTFTLRRNSGTPANLANVIIGRIKDTSDTGAKPMFAPLALVGSEVPGAGAHTYVVNAEVNDVDVDGILQGSTGGAATMILMEVAP